MEILKLIAMPMEESIHLCIDMGIKLINHNHSQCLVWSLIFLKHIILKLSFVVSLCEHVYGCNATTSFGCNYEDFNIMWWYNVFCDPFLNWSWSMQDLWILLILIGQDNLKRKDQPQSMFKIGSCLIS